MLERCTSKVEPHVKLVIEFVLLCIWEIYVRCRYLWLRHTEDEYSHVSHGDVFFADVMGCQRVTDLAQTDNEIT